MPPYWAVARTLVHRESFAAERVAEAGFQVFMPRIKTRIGARWLTTPLFRNYLFGRIIDRWRIVERTLGVMKLVKFGDAPAHCPDAEIAALLERSDADGIVRLPPRAPPRARHVFAAGDPLMIVDGPLKGLSAIHSGMTAREREIVLIDLIGRQRPVAVPAELVAPKEARS